MFLGALSKGWDKEVGGRGSPFWDTFPNIAWKWVQKQHKLLPKNPKTGYIPSIRHNMIWYVIAVDIQ